MRHYELLMVLKPDSDEERVEAVVDQVKRFVTDHGGEVSEEDHWGRRKLAYHIGNFSEGNYYLAKLQLEPSPAKELEGTLEFSEDILRHLLVRQDS